MQISLKYPLIPAFRFMLKVTLLGLIIFAWTPRSFATQLNSEQVAAFGELLETLVNWQTPELAQSASQVFTSQPRDWSQQDSGLWRMVRSWIRIYKLELTHGESQCQIDPTYFSAQVEDSIARSQWDKSIFTPLKKELTHVSMGTAEIGARLGTTALVAKATSEVAETILSKAIGGGGVHIVCNLIDAAIIFGTRRMQSSWRILKEGGPLRSLQQAVISRSAYRSFKRIQVEATFEELEGDLVREVDHKGSKRLWGLLTEGKRAHWLKRLKKNGRISIKQKDFLGQRKKRYLYTVSNKRGNNSYLRGKTEIDALFNKNILWIFSLQENVIQDATISSDTLPSSDSSPLDPFQLSLIEEFAPNLKPEQVSNLMDWFQTIQEIHNPRRPKTKRYADILVLETVLVSLIQKIFNEIVEDKTKIIGTGFGAIWERSRIQWNLGKISTHIYRWTDQMRLISLTQDQKTLLRSEEDSYEMLLRLFQFWQKAIQIRNLSSKEELQQFESQLQSDIQKIKAFSPWLEKTQQNLWQMIQFKTPRCEELQMEEH